MGSERGRKKPNQGGLGLSNRVHQQEKKTADLEKRLNAVESAAGVGSKPQSVDLAQVGQTVTITTTDGKHYTGPVEAVGRFLVCIRIDGCLRRFNKGQIVYTDERAD